jgi:hypothetical protein
MSNNITTLTAAGPVVITHRGLVNLREWEGFNNGGDVALCIMLNAQGQPACWGLVYQAGGDWEVFEDEIRDNYDALQGWESDAVREAVAAAVAANPSCEDDLDWYIEWADDVDSTLEAGNAAAKTAANA